MGDSPVTGPIIPLTIRFPLLHAVLLSEGIAIVGLTAGPVEDVRLGVSLLPSPHS